MPGSQVPWTTGASWSDVRHRRLYRPEERDRDTLSALNRLEYRGYDSAGIAVAGSKLQIHKDKGEIAVMEATLPPMKGGIGVAHTRWATCGKPSKENAHPFRDCTGNIALVHNGIIENFSELKAALISRGAQVHLGDRHRGAGPSAGEA